MEVIDKEKSLISIPTTGRIPYEALICRFTILSALMEVNNIIDVTHCNRVCVDQLSPILIILQKLLAQAFIASVTYKPKVFFL